MANITGSLQAPMPVQDGTQNQINQADYTAMSEHLGQVMSKATGVAADTEFTVTHGLGRVPSQVELLVAEAQGANNVVIYPSGTAWTKTTVYLKASAATVTVKLRIS